MKGFRHHLRNVLNALDSRCPFRDLLEHFVDEGGVVDTVKRLEVGFQRHRAADMNHRGRGAVGLCHAGHGIDATGPGRDEAHAGLARQAAVGVRHEGGIRLLLAGDEPDGLDAAQPVIDRMSYNFV